MRVLALGALALCVSGCTAPRQEKVTMSQVQRISPLRDADVMAFATTRDAAACRAFYEGKLGLRVLVEDSLALMLDSGGTVIRIQKIPTHEPEKFTVLGWKVSDIRATAGRLKEAGVKIELYDWLDIQDDSGVATFSNGDMVAWFKDPDGNILSLAQLK
jgi:catechol 2,3-dioxygenase-like lactoylglutathione lyase family enzyme